MVHASFAEHDYVALAVTAGGADDLFDIISSP